MSDDQRYTLEEAQRELARRQCELHGHDWEILSTSRGPAALLCARCGDERRVLQPGDAAIPSTLPNPDQPIEVVVHRPGQEGGAATVVLQYRRIVKGSLGEVLDQHELARREMSQEEIDAIQRDPEWPKLIEEADGRAFARYFFPDMALPELS